MQDHKITLHGIDILQSLCMLKQMTVRMVEINIKQFMYLYHFLYAKERNSIIKYHLVHHKQLE